MKGIEPNFTKPSVKVIARNDHRLDAWQLSRPRTEAHKVEDFQHIPFGLQDLDHVVVDFHCSAAFRELLATTPTYFMWSQSSRNIGLENIPLNSNTSEMKKEIMTKMWKDSLDLTSQGHQDTGRMMLPIGYMNSLTVQAPLRTFIGLYKSLDELNCGAYLIDYIIPVFEQLGYGSKSEILHEMYEGIFKHYGTCHNFSTINEEEWEEGSVKLSGSRIISSKMSIGLRAQLARQSQVQLSDNIWNLLAKEKEDIELYPLSAELKTTAVMTNEAYLAVCQKRSCFIAQIELWSNFIMEGVKELGFPKALPCGGCKSDCPLEIEAIDCEERNATTLPCPIYSGKDHWEARKDYIGEDHPIVEVMDPYFKSL